MLVLLSWLKSGDWISCVRLCETEKRERQEETRILKSSRKIHLTPGPVICLTWFWCHYPPAKKSIFAFRGPCRLGVCPGCFYWNTLSGRCCSRHALLSSVRFLQSFIGTWFMRTKKPDPPSWLQLPSLMSADKLLVCMLRFFGDNWLALLVCRHVSLTHFWRSIALQSDELAHVFCPLWPPPTHAPRVIKHRNGSTMSELVPTPARGTTLLPAQI